MGSVYYTYPYYSHWLSCWRRWIFLGDTVNSSFSATKKSLKLFVRVLGVQRLVPKNPVTKKSRDISLDLFWALYIYIYIHLVFQATSTSKVIIIRYNLTPYKWPKLHVFFGGVLSYNPTYNRSYNPTYNITKDAWGEIDMGPYKWPFQWVTGVIKL